MDSDWYEKRKTPPPLLDSFPSLLPSHLPLCDAHLFYIPCSTPKNCHSLIILVLVWVLESTAQDLESFARHGKRSTIQTEDVLLLARRNEGLESILRDFVDKRLSGGTEGPGQDADSDGEGGEAPGKKNRKMKMKKKKKESGKGHRKA